MFTVTYIYIHPVDASNVPALTPQEVAYRADLLAWGYDNGLLSINIEMVSPIEKRYTTRWETRQHFEAFKAHFGEAYLDYHNGVIARVQADGGTFLYSEQEE